MVASPGMAQESLAQGDDVRQIQVIPFHPGVVRRDPFETRVEAAPDVYDHGFGLTANKVPGVTVEFAREQVAHHVEQCGHPDLPDLGKVEARLRDQRHGFLVPDQGIRALRFQRPQ